MKTPDNSNGGLNEEQVKIIEKSIPPELRSLKWSAGRDESGAIIFEFGFDPAIYQTSEFAQLMKDKSDELKRIQAERREFIGNRIVSIKEHNKLAIRAIEKLSEKEGDDFFTCLWMLSHMRPDEEVFGFAIRNIEQETGISIDPNMHYFLKYCYQRIDGIYAGNKKSKALAAGLNNEPDKDQAKIMAKAALRKKIKIARGQIIRKLNATPKRRILAVPKTGKEKTVSRAGREQAKDMRHYVHDDLSVSDTDIPANVTNSLLNSVQSRARRNVDI